MVAVLHLCVIRGDNQIAVCLPWARPWRGHGEWRSEDNQLEELEPGEGRETGSCREVTKVPVSSSPITKEGLCILPGEVVEKGGLAKVANELSFEG